MSLLKPIDSIESNGHVDHFKDLLDEITEHPTWSPVTKIKAYFELFNELILSVSASEQLHFTTLFSRLAYVGVKFQFSQTSLHFYHVFRKVIKNNQIDPNQTTALMHLGRYVCSKLLFDLYQIPLSSETHDLWKHFKQVFPPNETKSQGFKAVVEALVFQVDMLEKKMYFYDEQTPTIEQIAIFDVHDKNELFTPNITSLYKNFKLPLHVNLIDVDILEDGIYLPSAIILNPDHLLDVTAVSECMKDYGAEPILYLLSKFKASESSPALLIGNIVNMMMNEIIEDADIDFTKIKRKLFNVDPLAFALLDDDAVKLLIAKVYEHYKHLCRVVHHEFPHFMIERAHIYVEPSFYSRDYGIQGRLDLLHQRAQDDMYDIIELKSGKTYKPNAYGINVGHYTQTLLYDLLIKSTFHPKTKSYNYILYSKEENKQLRYAPPVKAQQYEAMKVRNDLISIEQKLQQGTVDPTIFNYVKSENFPKSKGFNKKEIAQFHHVYSTLDDTEKAYFNRCCAFIAKEQALAKTGEHGSEKSFGHAALWLENRVEKKARFEIMDGLEIIHNASMSDEAYLTLRRNVEGESLVSFRVGDIGVLYPDSKEEKNVILNNQIFKCTISAIDHDTVEIKLRNKQFNQTLFDEVAFWCIEPDSLDSGFNSMYKNVFLWASATKEYRSLIMGKTKPSNFPKASIDFGNTNMTAHQADIVCQMLAAKNYYLLWGPPGTGKTSVVLHYLVDHLYYKSQETVLLLAYTNKAVDEICDAILHLDRNGSLGFLRIGSRLSTNQKFHNHLLDQVLKKATSRQEILNVLAEKRIFVSTIASIINRSEIFQLKQFNTVIIDEASQILEPMLIGLLSKFQKFVLIGDHKQLPAVVVQDKETSVPENENLAQLGITDLRVSLFERLYFHLRSQGWTEAMGILSEQGRFHEKLCAFPNQHFYEGTLSILPGLHRQIKSHFFDHTLSHNHYLQNRTLFIPCPIDQNVQWKTNTHEAYLCVKVIQDLIQLFELNQMKISNQSIGIITPYRAQIAMIQKYMSALPNALASLITVDTVERYQGGSRDIIILSFCINKESQLNTLVSLSQEGIDRKLNVALTRAKEQIILIGNEALLSKNKIYLQLIQSYQKVIL